MSLETLKTKVGLLIEKAQSGGGGTEEIENIIDASGVLDSTEGTVEDKVEELIDYVCLFNQLSSLVFKGNKEIETIDVYLDKPYSSCQEAFSGCANLKHIVGINTSKATMNGKMFYNSGIEIIDEPFDFSSQLSASNFSPFDNADFLVEVRIVPNTYKWTSSIHSPVLSDESIQSIVDGLAPVSTSQSIRFSSAVIAKLTDKQKATISSKGWTLVQL
jgi:hypothetical protein